MIVLLSISFVFFFKQWSETYTETVLLSLTIYFTFPDMSLLFKYIKKKTIEFMETSCNVAEYNKMITLALGNF